MRQSYQIKFSEGILPFDPESVVSLRAIRKHTRKYCKYGTAILITFIGRLNALDYTKLRS